MQDFTDKTAPYQIPFEAFGIELRICTNTPELLERIKGMMPPGWRRRPRSSNQVRLGLIVEDENLYSVYRPDGACIHQAPGSEYALMVLDTQIEGNLAREAPGLVFVHAGVVSDGTRVMVIPGLSFSGKTTLVRALVEAGAVYYSDEFAVLDQSGRVYPYPRPLSIRGEESPTVDYQVEHFGGIAGTKPLPVGMVVLTSFRPGADWNPDELSKGNGVLAVLEHAVPARSRPRETLQVLSSALDGATILHGERGDADGLAPHLLDALRAVT